MNKYRMDVPDGPERSLLDDYLARRHEDVRNLRAALVSNDLRHARMIGHRLYGSGSAYGLPRVSILGRDIEQAAHSRNRSRLAEAIEGLAALLDDVVIGDVP